MGVQGQVLFIAVIGRILALEGYAAVVDLGTGAVGVFLGTALERPSEVQECSLGYLSYGLVVLGFLRGRGLHPEISQLGDNKVHLPCHKLDRYHLFLAGVNYLELLEYDLRFLEYGVISVVELKRPITDLGRNFARVQVIIDSLSLHNLPLEVPSCLLGLLFVGGVDILLVQKEILVPIRVASLVLLVPVADIPSIEEVVRQVGALDRGESKNRSEEP